MKVEKIDIKKELLDIPEGRMYMDFIERPNLFSQEVMASKLRYIVQEIRTDEGQKKYYLIKIDDKELFRELIDIRNRLLNRLINKRTNFWREKIVEEIYNENLRIKKLSWWKRLFKRF